MRHILLLAASALPLMTLAADDASAQRRFGGAGFHAGGFHGGAFRAGGWGGRPMGFRSGWYGHRGAGWGGGWNRPYVRSGYWGGGRRGWGWGAAAGLIAGTALGAAAAYPSYNYSYPSYGYRYPSYDYSYNDYSYDDYSYPSSYYSYSYPVYAAPVANEIGGYCATPVRTCALMVPSIVGNGCSCSIPGGRARGTVIGP